MVLSKNELLAALQSEVAVLLHLIGKITPDDAEYRPSPEQRSVLELVRYFVIMPGIHLRAVIAGLIDFPAWGKEWQSEGARAGAMDLVQATEAIAAQPAWLAETLAPLSDAQLRERIKLFGRENSRGAWIVSLVLCHYAAYRMQLFLYLKASGHPELNTLNLWAGQDAVNVRVVSDPA